MQKTAYEMRISDWSSDVCSSDLAKNFQDASRSLFGSGANFFADVDSIKAMLTGAKGSVGTDADLPASPFATDTAVQNAINSLNGTTAHQKSTLHGPLQIGRASCRERVCQ